MPRPLVAPELIVVGELEGPDGIELAVELFRRPFTGWGVEHLLVPERASTPRRYLVLDGYVRAEGYLPGKRVEAGAVVRVAVPRPPP